MFKDNTEGIKTMIYICDKCRFIFSRFGAVNSCSDCGKQLVRAAKPEEIEEYKKIQAIVAKEEKDKYD
jgi:DNA-directed RNA polymerase subunit RPC12/RpoP